MDSTEKSKTMAQRRTSIADTRKSCILFDPNQKIMWEQNDIACFPLKTCDEKCKADPKARKHIIYKCMNAKLCMSEAPD